MIETKNIMAFVNTRLNGQYQSLQAKLGGILVEISIGLFTWAESRV